MSAHGSIANSSYLISYNSCILLRLLRLLVICYTRPWLIQVNFISETDHRGVIMFSAAGNYASLLKVILPS